MGKTVDEELMELNEMHLAIQIRNLIAGGFYDDALAMAEEHKQELTWFQHTILLIEILKAGIPRLSPRDQKKAKKRLRKAADKIRKRIASE